MIRWRIAKDYISGLDCFEILAMGSLHLIDMAYYTRISF